MVWTSFLENVQENHGLHHNFYKIGRIPRLVRTYPIFTIQTLRKGKGHGKIRPTDQLRVIQCRFTDSGMPVMPVDSYLPSLLSKA